MVTPLIASAKALGATMSLTICVGRGKRERAPWKYPIGCRLSETHGKLGLIPVLRVSGEPGVGLVLRADCAANAEAGRGVSGVDGVR